MEIFKRQEFSKEELAMLFTAFNKRLFTRPKKGEMFSSVSWNIPGGQSLLFRFEFYETLTEEMKQAKDSGKFASSNAEAKWNRLFDKLISASVDFGSLGEDSDYYLKCSPYWD